MSTSKPRITVTLSPKTATQLRRIAELTGGSQSSLVSEVLEQADHVFSRLIVVLEAAEKAKSTVRKESIRTLDDAQKKIEEQLGIAMANFDKATGSVIEAFEEGAAPAEGASKAVKGRKVTSLSNRGVRSPTDHHLKTNKRPSKC